MNRQIARPCDQAPGLESLREILALRAFLRGLFRSYDDGTPLPNQAYDVTTSP